jgi:hypothetical protein
VRDIFHRNNEAHMIIQILLKLEQEGGQRMQSIQKVIFTGCRKPIKPDMLSTFYQIDPKARKPSARL